MLFRIALHLTYCLCLEGSNAVCSRAAYFYAYCYRRTAGVLSTLTAAVSAQEGSKKGNTVLVVDEDALTILNACIPPDELIRSGFISASLGR